MFGLIRWLFLLGIIVALLGFLVGKPIHGRTPAESFCKLIDNPECSRLADRGASQMAWVKSRWDAASGTPSSATAHAPAPKTASEEPAREASKPSHAVPTAPAPAPAAPSAPVAVATPNAPPLDHHSASERHALDRILTQRGSR